MASATHSPGLALAERLGITIIGTEGHDLKAACVECESSNAFRIHQDTAVSFCFSCNKSFSPLRLTEKFTVDQRAAWEILERIGLAEPRQEKASRSGSGSEPTQPAKPASVLEAIAKLKRVPVNSLLAYAAMIHPKKTDALVFPMYGPNGQQCSSYWMTESNGKGCYQKAKKTGLFLPITDAALQAELNGSGENIDVNDAVRWPVKGETWLGFEGVKDPAAAHARGHLAFGMPSNSMSAKFARRFAGVHVILVPDLDKAGFNGANKTAANLAGFAASIRIARLPGELRASKGDDYRDVLHQQDGEELTAQAIAEATLWEPTRDPNVPAEIDPLTLLDDRGRNDLANAKRLVRLCGDDIRWCEPWGKWLVWDGTHWEIDKQRAIETKAKQVSESLWPEIAVLASKADDSLLATMTQFARTSSSANAIRNMIALARSEYGIPIRPEQLDSDPWKLNCINGTVDLQTGKVHSHSREDLITKLCSVEFNPDAECSLWLQSLLEWMGGSDEMTSYLQRNVGYSITGSVREQCMSICHGAGENGKSVFLNTVAAVLGGDYGMKAPTDFLMIRQGESHPTERTDLCGKRFVSCIEIEDGRRLSESLVKELTGGDAIRARRMREDFWEFQPTHKIWLSTNHKPGIRGTDHGIWRRIKLIPFEVKIDPSKKDPDLSNKLRDEFPGILAWAVRGCLDWQKNGLGEPAAVQMATLAYRSEMDAIGTFIEQKCHCSEGLNAKSSELYAAYRAWCSANGEHELNQRRFGMSLTERGYRRYTNNGTHYAGIGVLLDAFAE